jgi:hypothetical protein
MQTLRTILCLVLIACIASLGPTLQTARAELIRTEAVVDGERSDTAARDRVRAFLARGEVRAQLEAWGISPDEAQARVDALGDAEVEALAGRIEAAPAGGSALGAFIVTALIVILVLLVTDIFGFTDIFPWVGSTRNR